MPPPIARFTWLALFIGGCSLAPTTPAPAQFDLGPSSQVAPSAAAPALRLLAVHAPSWLDGTGISYRLAFQDPYRREIYRDSRWVAPPATLIAGRLRTLMPTGASDPQAPLLRLELEECDQHFDAPDRSRVVLRVTATLSAPGGAAPPATRRTTFEVEAASPTADAHGAVSGLAAAVDRLASRLNDWIAQPAGMN